MKNLQDDIEKRYNGIGCYPKYVFSFFRITQIKPDTEIINEQTGEYENS